MGFPRSESLTMTEVTFAAAALAGTLAVALAAARGLLRVLRLRVRLVAPERHRSHVPHEVAAAAAPRGHALGVEPAPTPLRRKCTATPHHGWRPPTP